MIDSQMRAHQERYRDLRREADARHAARPDTTDDTSRPWRLAHSLRWIGPWVRRSGGRSDRFRRAPSGR